MPLPGVPTAALSVPAYNRQLVSRRDRQTGDEKRDYIMRARRADPA